MCCASSRSVPARPVASLTGSPLRRARADICLQASPLCSQRLSSELLLCAREGLELRWRRHERGVALDERCLGIDAILVTVLETATATVEYVIITWLLLVMLMVMVMLLVMLMLPVRGGRGTVHGLARK